MERFLKSWTKAKGARGSLIFMGKQKMESTTPDDYGQLPATTLENEGEETEEEAKQNIVSVLKKLNPFAR